jgi:hypothetical protein
VIRNCLTIKIRLSTCAGRKFSVSHHDSPRHSSTHLSTSTTTLYYILSQLQQISAIQVELIPGHSGYVSAKLPLLNEALNLRLPERAPDLSQSDQALQSPKFRESFDFCQPIITVFGMMLFEISQFYQGQEDKPPPSDNYIHASWLELQAVFRDRTQPIYSDPESIQVAQMMNRMDQVSIWTELVQYYHSQILGDDPNEPLGGRGESYESVRRGTAWLSECTIIGLDTTIMDAETAHAVKANLAAVATHSVLYEDIELNNEAELRHTIFGPDGVLWSVMEVFASDAKQGKRLYGIQSLSVVVMHQPMNIAEIFHRFSTLGGEHFNNTAE